MDDEAFVRATEIFFVIPLATEADIRDALTASVDSGNKHRLDELLPLYVVLQTLYLKRDELDSYFGRISISLELRASGVAPRISNTQNAPQESSTARQEDIIWVGNLVAAEEPIVITSHGGDEASSRIVFAIWEVKALLST
ncbi:MAG: hypothetical protein Q9163_000763 [Psora crenata]